MIESRVGVTRFYGDHLIIVVDNALSMQVLAQRDGGPHVEVRIAIDDALELLKRLADLLGDELEVDVEEFHQKLTAYLAKDDPAGAS